MKGGVSQTPGAPPLLHTRNPSLGRGRGPVPTLRAEFRGGWGPSGAASSSPGTMGPGRGARPPDLRSNSPFLPTFARAEPGARGGGVSKPGIQGWGEIQAWLRQSLPRPSRPKLFCSPIFPLQLSLCKPELALAEFAICKLGRRRCCKPRKAAPLQAGGEFAMHASPGGPGRAGPGPTQLGPHPLAPSSRPPSAPYLALADLS